MYSESIIHEEIILIADRINHSTELIDIHSKDLEKIGNEYFEDISEGLRSICKTLIHYDSPKELIDNIQKHTQSIVFTIYGGSISLNRMALVPAICESYGLRFAGADAYARIVCQDKFLSKILAKRHAINTAKGILIDKLSRLSYIEELTMPVVVKPNFEGSSIGISEKSLVDTISKAKKLTQNLLNEFNQPVLIEEFIPGKEVCICILGTSKSIDFLEAIEVQYASNTSHFHNKLYTAFDKHVTEEKIIHMPCTNLLTITEKKALRSLYSSFGKMDFMRIDGRINEKGFTLIELTPDAFLGKSSSIADAGKLNNMSYTEVLNKIIHNALEYYRTPYSNYKES